MTTAAARPPVCRCPACGALLDIDWSRGHRPRCPEEPGTTDRPTPEAVAP